MAHRVKRNLREFSGFPDDHVDKMKASAHRCTLATLKEVLGICGLEVSGTKEGVVDRLAAFLRRPGKGNGRGKSPKGKASQGRARAAVWCHGVLTGAQRAGASSATGRKRSVGEAQKGDARSAQTGEHAAALEAYIGAKLDRLKEDNPTVSEKELRTYLSSKWASLSAVKRRKFQVRSPHEWPVV